ncbi:MAG: DUF3786 domain-containing protein [Candidatus Latescibacterota bacterium]
MSAKSGQESTRYQTAFSLAREKLLQSDLGERCAKAGAVYTPSEQCIVLRFVDHPCKIHLPEVTFEVLEDGSELGIAEQILILHYLSMASGTPPSAERITFGQIPDGSFYVPVFRKRTVDWLVGVYGEKPEGLFEAARRIGACPADYGDVGVTIQAFPNVSVTLVLWRGDDELAPSGSALFDATISEYLPAEDVVVLTSMLVGKLCRP